MVVCVFLLISLLIVGGIGFGIYRLIHPAREIVAEYDYDSGEDSSSSEPAYTEEEEETEDAGETRDYNDSEDEWSDDTDNEDDLTRGSVNAKAASEYVIPYSNQRLLGDSDVAGLSLREINYAKNEIYARHGRNLIPRSCRIISTVRAGIMARSSRRILTYLCLRMWKRKCRVFK